MRIEASREEDEGASPYGDLMEEAKNLLPRAKQSSNLKRSAPFAEVT